MATSETEIVNLALARVGQGTIVNINDNDRLSRTAKLHYATKRDNLLRMYRWKFAIKRIELPALLTAPVFGYEYAYQLPTDCIRVLSVNEIDPEFDPDIDITLWDREGDTIVTDESAPIKVKYIRRVTDPNHFDPAFKDALSAYLSIYFAPSFRETESNLTTKLMEEFEITVRNAKYISAIEGRPRKRRLTRSGWLGGYR